MPRRKKTTQAPVQTTDEKPIPIDGKVLTLGQMFWRAGLLSLVFAFGLLLITALIVGLWGYGKFRQFLRAAETNQAIFTEQLSEGWSRQPVNSERHKNILILGTDTLAGRGDVPPLTDTMMLVSIDLNEGKINTLALPRDLWSEDYQTKINALYAYGFERDSTQPTLFPTQVISELTGLPIHHTLVLSLDQLRELIDLVDGVEIEVQQSFTDPLFPREGVDVTTERDPAKLYETISFSAGKQTLTGERALQYIRSRHSEDEQGHDLARGQRQQQVISALLHRLTNVGWLISHPQQAGELYHFYQTNFATALPLTELVATAKTLLPNRDNLNFQSHQLTDIDDDPANGVINNPPLSTSYQRQWVYIITDEAKFQTTVQSALLGK